MFSAPNNRTPSYPLATATDLQQSSKLSLATQPSLTAAARVEPQGFQNASKHSAAAANKASILKYETLTSSSNKYDGLPSSAESNLEQPEHSYHGQIKDGLFHGKGKLTYNTNERYEVIY